MPSINDMKASREQHLAEAKLLRDRAKAGGRDLTDAETGQIESLLEVCDSLTAQIDTTEGRYHGLDKRAPVDHRIEQHSSLGEGVPRSILGFKSPPARSTTRRSREEVGFWRSLFGEPSADTAGFSSFNEFMAVVDSGRFDPRLQAINKGGTNSAGGYMVPEMFMSQLMDPAIQDAVLLPRVDTRPMATDTLNISGIGDAANSHASVLYGGLKSYWVSEGTAPTASEFETRRITLRTKKLMLLNSYSNELRADAENFDREVGAAIANTMVHTLDGAILNGTGAGQPLGVANDAALVVVSKESGQDADSIWWSNVVAMYSRLHPALVRKSIWLAHPTAVPELLTLDIHQDSAGSGSLVGDSVYMPLRETDGGWQMLGLPLYLTEHCSELGEQGDIYLICPSEYVLGMRRDVTIERSQHVGFTSDVEYVRSVCRCDGMGKWSAPFTPKGTSTTLSWCVTLAERGE